MEKEHRVMVEKKKGTDNVRDDDFVYVTRSSGEYMTSQGVTNQRRVLTYYLARFAENCMKMKNTCCKVYLYRLHA